MEALKLRQNLTFEQLNKLMSSYKSYPKVIKTVSYLETCVEKVQQIWEDFRSCHAQILAEVKCKADLQDEYFIEDTYNKFEDLHLQFSSELKEMLRASGVLSGTAAEPLSKSEVKLPPIVIPTFGGDYADWTSFKDLFVSLIHHRQSISKVEKMHYLKCNLSGEPASLLKHLVVTEANYEIAWKLLNERYDNTYILLTSQFKELFKIGAAVETSTSIKALLDKTNECVQIIENLKVADLWNAVLVFITTQRLPTNTRQLWEQQQQGTNDNLAAFGDLRQFLNSRFHALEAAGVDQLKSQKIMYAPTRNVHAVNTGQDPVCVLCKNIHPLHKCIDFSQLNQDEKFNIVKRNGLCLNCIRKGHMMNNCPSKLRCFKCQRAHHTLLHKDIVQNTVEEIQEKSSTNNILCDAPPTSEIREVHSTNSTNMKQVLLATALIQLESNTAPIVLRALLDQGSQTSLISESAVHRLGLKRKTTGISIAGIGNSSNHAIKGITNVILQTNHKEKIEFEALILEKLTNMIPSRIVSTSILQHLRREDLADPHFDRPGHIDILLGADIYARIILGDIHRTPEGPIAQKTKLGWIISGEIHTSSNSYQSFKVEVNDDWTLTNQLKQFWEIEEVTLTRKYTEEEQQCEQHFKQNVRRNPNGRFVVKLPFKSNKAQQSLGTSILSAIGSFLAIEKRLIANPDLHAQYSSSMKEYIEKGYMELAPNNVDHERVNGKTVCTAVYLPHHAVYRDSSTTKCRIVFDASRKTSTGISLNDTLLTGPAIQNDMLAVLTRWRLYLYAWIADISKMFLQIEMEPEDVDYQRIVWRSDPKEDIRDYCLTRVTFGTTCAPFLAIRCLQKLAEEVQTSNVKIFDAIMNEFYVDDLLSGDHDITDALTKRNDIIDILESAGFPLRKWISNDPRILENLPAEDIEMEPTISVDIEQGYKSLGIIWYPLTDQFGYKLNLKAFNKVEGITKRQVLSEVAKLYDPLGWLAPVLITAKILLKYIWRHGIEWDDLLNGELLQTWTKFRVDIQKLERLRISRWMNYTPSAKFELHGFCDASIEAYAANAYLVVREGKNVYSHLIMAKTKVTPTKFVSIAHLELCAAVLLAKLIRRIKDILKFERIYTNLWSDSTTVLAWLNEHPMKWETFVANRTTQIQTEVSDAHWKYVPSKQNPADPASRGLEVDQLIDSRLWWHGPIWITQSTDNWPKKEIKAVEDERKKKKLVHLNITTDFEQIQHKFSSLARLIRVTAYCFRFGELTKKETSIRSHLSVKELRRAFIFWIKHIQHKQFNSELRKLERNEQLENGSKLSKLNPFIDGEGLIRVGSRLTNAALSFDEQSPIVLPKNERIVELFLRQLHIETLHGQTQLMLQTLRRKFWLLDARNTIKKIIHNCVKCYRASAKGATQLMGSLPSARTTISKPFTHTGVDNCGPFDIKDRKGRGGKIYKGYVAIFICLCVKAIHIEIVSDLTSQAFLAALHRFMGRRGKCGHLYSDCGTNFVGAKTEMDRIMKIASQFAAEELANQGIAWHFNPPASPHFGGLWEAGVKSIKTHFRRLIGNRALTYEELSTVMIRIEACLNSRPLCPLNDDPSDAQVLTPAHFLTGDSILAPPELDLMDTSRNRLDRWQQTQQLAQTFWKWWKIEYISRLQARPKWLIKQHCPKIGDICVMKDEKSPPYQWPLARIVDTHPGKDQLVRVVSLKVNGKILKRPITKIACLPNQDVFDEK